MTGDRRTAAGINASYRHPRTVPSRNRPVTNQDLPARHDP
jgi:hypothetical protein